MPTLKEYNVKIARLRSTRKMTRTMKMVSANKLRKSQELLKQAGICTEQVDSMVARLPAEALEAAREECGRRAESPRALVLLISSDRGLCGGFNNNLNRRVQQWMQERDGGGDGLRMSFCGRRGYLYFRSRVAVEKYYAVASAKPQFLEARRIFGELATAYRACRFAEVYLAYNQFRSSLSQVPVIEQLLPVVPGPATSSETPTRHRAVAERVVTSFAVTSTMRASPRSFRCVSGLSVMRAP